MLEAMQRARYSILGIDEVFDGLGVFARDLLRSESLLLVDENMAACMEAGMLITGRLLVFDDFCMTTGTVLPMDPGIMEKACLALERLLASRTVEEMRSLSGVEQSELSAAVIRICLESGASDRVQYKR